MRSKHNFYTSALVGVVIGLVSTYPIALGFIPSFILWAIAGILLGLCAHGMKTIIWSGILYGVFLSVSFLFSRFGGTADKIFAYALFVVGMSLVGAVGGSITIYVGSKLRR
jgi:hypothetical protein